MQRTRHRRRGIHTPAYTTKSPRREQARRVSRLRESNRMSGKKAQVPWTDMENLELMWQCHPERGDDALKPQHVKLPGRTSESNRSRYVLLKEYEWATKQYARLRRECEKVSNRRPNVEWRGVPEKAKSLEGGTPWLPVYNLILIEGRHAGRGRPPLPFAVIDLPGRSEGSVSNQYAHLNKEGEVHPFLTKTYDEVCAELDRLIYEFSKEHSALPPVPVASTAPAVAAADKQPAEAGYGSSDAPRALGAFRTYPDVGSSSGS